MQIGRWEIPLLPDSVDKRSLKTSQLKGTWQVLAQAMLKDIKYINSLDQIVWSGQEIST